MSEKFLCVCCEERTVSFGEETDDGVGFDCLCRKSDMCNECSRCYHHCLCENFSSLIDRGVENGWTLDRAIGYIDGVMGAIHMVIYDGGKGGSYGTLPPKSE